MKKLFIIATIALSCMFPMYARAVQAVAPTVTNGTGVYTGRVQVGPITDANAGTKITCGTVDNSTPVTNGLGTACNNGFAISHYPGYYTIGYTVSPTILKLVTGTSTLTDSTPLTNTYTVNQGTIGAIAWGLQCQSNANNCTNFTIPATAPARFRIWDCASPFWGDGTNCTWASIEFSAPGTYNFTALDSWLDALSVYKGLHPTAVASFTFGSVSCQQVTLPGPYNSILTGAAVNGLTGTNAQITYSFANNATGTKTLFGLYATITGMNDGANNLTQFPIVAWSSTSITVQGHQGTASASGNTGTLTIVGGPKGCTIAPDDLPLVTGAPWDGTGTMPVGSACAHGLAIGSCSFNNYVFALVNHCHLGHCFANLIDYIEGWNEPNNNFFWSPGFNSIPQTYQLLAGAMPLIRAAMPNVIVDTTATTASAGVMSQLINIESTYGMISDEYAWHQYWGTAPSGAPEAQIPNMLSIANKRLLVANPGWSVVPWRITEFSWQSNNTPYNCSSGNPWTDADCIGQMVRWQLIMMSNGGAGGDWYNWDVNIGKVSTYLAAFAQMQTMMIGGQFTSTCSQVSNLYTCGFTGPTGLLDLWAWKYCPNDGNYATCSVNAVPNYTVPAGYTDYINLAGVTVSVRAGSTIVVGVQPILLEQNSVNAPSAVNPFID